MIQFALTSLIFLGLPVLLVLGLNVQFGLTGILNLAFIVFYAAGAYTAGVMTSTTAGPARPHLHRRLELAVLLSASLGA